MKLVKVDSDKLIRKFIDLPFTIYKNDPHWVPPLNSMIKKVIKKGSTVMNSGREFYLVFDNGKPVARMGVYINKNVLAHGNNVGFFTLFESFNNQNAVDLLIERADTWFSKRKISAYIGPESPTNGDDYKGMLIKNFENSPYIYLNYNPPYYGNLIKNAGFVPNTHLACFKFDLRGKFPEKKVQLIEKAMERYNIHVTSPDVKNLDKAAHDMRIVMENSIPDEWVGVRPPTQEQMLDIVKEMKRFADPDLVAIAYKEDRPIGFSVAIPNYNPLFKKMKGKLLPFGWLVFLMGKKTVKTFRSITVFVDRAFQGKGVSFAMHYYIGKNAKEKGYVEAEGGIVGFENRKSFQDAVGAGGELYKEYMTFKREINY
jgi:GNAT superfamily N-acetyltransferase